MSQDSLPTQRSRWLTNPLTRSLFGHNAPFSIVTYRDRWRNDVPEQAPVLAFPQHDGFVIPLIPRSHCGWVSVVLHAGECRLQYRRRLYALQRPIVVQAHPSEIRMPGWLQTSFVAIGMVDYLRLNVSVAESVKPATCDESSAH